MSSKVILRLLAGIFDPLWLLTAALAGFVVGLGPWVLVRRRDPPLLLLVAAGLVYGASMLADVRWGFVDPWDRMSEIFAWVGMMWLLLSGIWSAAVLVQPAEQGELRPAADRMRLLRWFLPTLACVALASALLASLSGGAFAAVGLSLLLPSSLLSLYDTERVRRVRRSVAWLQLGTAVTFAAGYGPMLWWALSAGLRVPPLFVLPIVCGALVLVPVAVLWVLGLRERGWRWLAGMLVVWSLLGVGRAEWLTRTERALLRLDLSDLPTRALEGGSVPRGPRCIETPSSRCPEGEVPLWVWPADVPIGDRVLGRDGAILFSDSRVLGTVYFGTGQGGAPGVARLGEGSYRVAGKRAEGLQAALSAIEEMQASCGYDFSIEPSPDWTPQELVTLCRYGCAYGPGTDGCGQAVGPSCRGCTTRP